MGIVRGRLLALVSAAALPIASACSAGTDDASLDGSIEHFRSALNGNLDDEASSAVETLCPVLSAADWFYLSNATWPSDVSLVLADPRMQKAMTPFVGAASRPSTYRGGVRVQSGDAGTPGDVQSQYALAEKLMVQLRGEAKAGTPGAAAALARLLAQAQATSLPAARGPVDMAQHLTIIDYYNDGRAPRVQNFVTPLCCKGEISFPVDGTLHCSDTTSCLGNGEPPPGSVTAERNRRSGNSANSSCANASGGGVSVVQCGPERYAVVCDDGSLPSGCDESPGYSLNGGVLCCESPRK